MTETIRKIPVAVIAALAVQTVGGLIWAGGAAARIATLEERSASNGWWPSGWPGWRNRAWRRGRRSSGWSGGWRTRNEGRGRRG